MDAAVSSHPIRSIPLFDAGAGGPLALLAFDPERLADLMVSARGRYTVAGLRLGDALSRNWLKRAGNPYYGEIAAIADRIGQSGAFLLNLSYEWTCTAAVGADPEGGGNRLLRTLDWPLDGLGRDVVVARHEAEAGGYYNMTWPGFVGIATAMAPGRFSAAINQPPMRRYTFSCWLDWALERLRLSRSKSLPPTHLLRRVFDACETYEDAKRALIETPICMPAFFSLSGVAEHEGCVIERAENEAFVHEGPFCISNHWLAMPDEGRLRGFDSHGRRALMNEVYRDAVNDFSWLKPPILNPTTRLAVIANAGRNTLSVQGWERTGAATDVFTLA